MNAACGQLTIGTGEFTVQDNGIVRDKDGMIAFRLDDVAALRAALAASEAKRAELEDELRDQEREAAFWKKDSEKQATLIKSLREVFFSGSRDDTYRAVVAEARVAELEGLLEAVFEREHNPFEPNNQSAMYHKLKAALRGKEVQGE